MRYPTEAKHGNGGYRKVSGEGLSNEPQPTNTLADRFGELGFVIPGTVAPTLPSAPVTVPIHDPIPVRRPPLPLQGPSRFLGPVVAGFATGWYIGTLIWGDPFAPPAGVPADHDPADWHSPSWTWVPCTSPGTDASPPVRYFIANSGPMSCGTQVGLHPRHRDGDTFDTPQDAVLGITTHLPYVQAYLDEPIPVVGGPPDTKVRMLGEYLYTDDPIDAPWTYDGPLSPPALVPGYGTPVEYPSEEPELAPIMWPAVPVVGPYPSTLPDAGTQPSQPVEEPVRSPAPTTVPMPTLPPWAPPAVIMPPSVVVQPGQPPVPVQPPDTVIEVVPGGSPTVTQPPGTAPTNNPPNPREVWRKGETPAGPRGIRTVVNVATEVGDFINSMYAGVPDELRHSRCHQYDYYCQVATLYDVWDDPRFDAAEFVEAFVNNQLEDWFYGNIGQMLGQASRNLGILTGLNRALNAGGDAWNEFMEEEGIEGVDLLPTLAHDPETGAWSLHWELFGIQQPITGGTVPAGGG